MVTISALLKDLSASEALRYVLLLQELYKSPANGNTVLLKLTTAGTVQDLLSEEVMLPRDVTLPPVQLKKDGWVAVPLPRVTLPVPAYCAVRHTGIISNILITKRDISLLTF
jgi:hypothetical protein